MLLGRGGAMDSHPARQNKPEAIAGSYGGKIFTFGSFRLGVHNEGLHVRIAFCPPRPLISNPPPAGGDIDTLVVAPRHIERTDFFSSLFEMLKADPDVKELRVCRPRRHWCLVLFRAPTRLLMQR